MDWGAPRNFPSRWADENEGWEGPSAAVGGWSILPENSAVAQRPCDWCRGAASHYATAPPRGRGPVTALTAKWPLMGRWRGENCSDESALTISAALNSVRMPRREEGANSIR